MTFINEVAISLAQAKSEVEGIAEQVAVLIEKCQHVEGQIALALAGAEQIGEYNQQTGIEEDIERAAILINEIKDTQEYTSALAGEWEAKGEVAQGTIYKIEAVQGYVAEMGGVS